MSLFDKIRADIRSGPKSIGWIVAALHDRTKLPAMEAMEGLSGRNVPTDHDLAGDMILLQIQPRSVPLVLVQQMLEEMDAGQIKFTGVHTTDPLVRQDIPRSHVADDKWDWMHSTLSAPYHHWRDVEIRSTEKLTPADTLTLRQNNMRGWLDLHQDWFEPVGDKWRLGLTYGDLHAEVRRFYPDLWGVTRSTFRQMVAGNQRYEGKGLRAVDLRIL